MTKEESHVMKLRGLTLNEETENSISIQTFKNMVENLGDVDEDTNGITNTNQKIGPNDFGKVYTRKEKRTYKGICHKGIIDEDHFILPFGWQPLRSM